MKADSVFFCFFSQFLNLTLLVEHCLNILQLSLSRQGVPREVVLSLVLMQAFNLHFKAVFLKKPQHLLKKQVKRGQLDPHFSPSVEKRGSNPSARAQSPPHAPEQGPFSPTTAEPEQQNLFESHPELVTLLTVTLPGG